MKKYGKFILPIIVIIFALSCPDSEFEGINDLIPQPSAPGTPSVTVNVQVEGAGVCLNWENPANISQYTVYRKSGTGEYVKLEEISGSGTIYLDTSCPVDCALSYYLKFFYSDNSDFDSKITTPVTISSIIVDTYIVNGKVHLYWPGQSNVEEIGIFRKEGINNRVKINSLFINTNFYEDAYPPFGIETKYSIDVLYSNGTKLNSTDSTSVLITDFPIRNLNATVLKYNDRNVITWYPEDNVDSYKVYRYTSRTDQSPLVFPAFENSYVDLGSSGQGPLADTPYFYKVSCLKDGQEYPPNNTFAFGIYSGIADSLEPNNIYNPQAGDEASNLIFGKQEEAVLYSFADGSGSYVEDADWYQYTGAVNPVTINVIFKPNSPLIGNISLVLYQGAEYPLDNEANTLPLEKTGDLIFKLEFNTAGNDKIIDSYLIEIE